MGVEIHRNVHCGLNLLDEVIYPLGRNQTTHIFDGNHVGTESCQLFGFTHEVVVRKYGFGVLFAFEFVHQREFGVFGVHGVAHSAVGLTAILFDIFDGRFHIVHVIQSVEDTHDTQTALDSVAREALDNIVAVGSITEEVPTARESRQVGDIAHCFFDAFQPVPWVFAQETHHAIGHCAAPHLHCIERGIFVVGQYALHLTLVQTGCEGRLLAVAQG